MKDCIWITPKNAKLCESALYLFKKSFNLKKKSAPCVVEISAQSRYKLFINGKICSVGPSKGTREKLFYDEIDVSSFVKEGENDIEVYVMQLVPNDYFNRPSPVEGVMRTGVCGLAFSLSCGDVSVKADETWLCAKINDINLDRCASTYSGSVNEEVLASSYKNPSFESPVKLANVDTNENEHFWWGLSNGLFLHKRPIPLLNFEDKKIAFDGEYYDMGYETFGLIRFRIKGEGKVKIRYFECFGSENQKFKKDRLDRKLPIEPWVYDEITISEKDGEFIYEPFWFRCFRFIKIDTSDAVSVSIERFTEVNYPMFPRENYDFGRDDDNELWKISVRTLRRCMHESYEDCPYYEELQYAMDTSLQMLFNYQLTDDDLLARKAMDDFASSQRADGLMPSRYPSLSSQYIPSFQFYFIFMVYQHYIRFGDVSLVRKHLRAIDGVIEWFSHLITADGLVGQSKYWNFIDWSKPWVYDKERLCEGGVPLGVNEGVIGIYNPMMAYFLQLGAKLNAICGRNDVADEYLQKSDLLIKNTEKYFYDKEKHMYSDDVNHIYYSQHMQTWCVLSGVAKGNRAKQIMKASTRIEAKSTYAFAYFYFRALEVSGLYDLTSEMMDSYRSLLKLGCTTVPETPEEARSECHAWGALAIYEFSATVLGVRTENVSEKSVSIKPYIKDRNFAKGTVSTIGGDVFVSWKKENSAFEITVKSQNPITKTVYLPDGTTHVSSDKEFTLSCKI